MKPIKLTKCTYEGNVVTNDVLYVNPYSIDYMDESDEKVTRIHLNHKSFHVIETKEEIYEHYL